MKLYKIINRATDFGTNRSSKDFISFTLKTSIYIIVAIILGDYTDKIVLKSKTNKILGNDIHYYILLQTAINISTLYLFVLFFPEFMSEFQSSISGGYFVTIYFVMQSHYLIMLKQFTETIFNF